MTRVLKKGPLRRLPEAAAPPAPAHFHKSELESRSDEQAHGPSDRGGRVRVPTAARQPKKREASTKNAIFRRLRDARVRRRERADAGWVSRPSACSQHTPSRNFAPAAARLRPSNRGFFKHLRPAPRIIRRLSTVARRPAVYRVDYVAVAVGTGAAAGTSDGLRLIRSAGPSPGTTRIFTGANPAGKANVRIPRAAAPGSML